jgi:malto-oligosyltrehalose trehalohydrolase
MSGAKRHHVLPFGAEPIAQGVRFRLWAPAAASVALRLDGGGRDLPMAQDGDGWFAVTTDLAKPGSRYRYVIDDFPVPDPASRYQPDDVHGPSEVIDPAAHDWQDAAWRGRPWEEIILYELHVGSFSESGDFAGIERHLDHLVSLGVTAIELMPLADFPGTRNWGYDGVLPFAPDARYGRPEALKRLVEACHARGLAVFLDVVYNHFGPEGNYLGRVAPGFFTERHHTPWGAAIDFARAPVRNFFVENALYWLHEFNIDGLRFDAVHAILDDSDRHILLELAERIHAASRHDRPRHLILENDNNEAWPLRREDGQLRSYAAQWNDDLHHALHVLASGETGGYYEDYADAPVARLGRALAEGFAYQGEVSVHRDGARRGERSADLPPTAFVSFIQNHDQVGNNAFGRRLAKVSPPELLKLVSAIYLLAPQIPMLFMGEEWGADQPFPFFCDFEPDLADKVREGRRQEFARFPEFRDAAARARIPDPSAPETFAHAVLDWHAIAQPSHAEWLQFYRDILALRRQTIIPRLRGMGGESGTYRLIGDRGLAVTWQLGDGARLVLNANFGDAPIGPREPDGRRIFSVGAVFSIGRAEGDLLAPHSVTFGLA